MDEPQPGCVCFKSRCKPWIWLKLRLAYPGVATNWSRFDARRRPFVALDMQLTIRWGECACTFGYLILARLNQSSQAFDCAVIRENLMRAVLSVHFTIRVVGHCTGFV